MCVLHLSGVIWLISKLSQVLNKRQSEHKKQSYLLTCLVEGAKEPGTLCVQVCHSFIWFRTHLLVLQTDVSSCPVLREDWTGAEDITGVLHWGGGGGSTHRKLLMQPATTKWWSRPYSCIQKMSSDKQLLHLCLVFTLVFCMWNRTNVAHICWWGSFRKTFMIFVFIFSTS